MRTDNRSLTGAASARLIHPERLDTIDVLGPTIQFVTNPDEEEGGPCIMRGTVPPGVVIPLHRHADPETFIPLSGHLRGVMFHGDAFEWIDVRPGVIFHVPGDATHGFRNDGTEPAVVIIASTTTIGRFFREVGRPVGSGSPAAAAVPPSSEWVQRFLAISARYGYWNASPAENARVGIALPS